MEATTAAFREIAVPVSIFGTLRQELSKEAGALPTIHALHHAGYHAGEAAAASFGGADGVQGMAQSAFWARVSDFFARRGWGTLTLSEQKGVVALLSSGDWVEATAGEPSEDASCSFSTGFLSGLLSTLAGGPVAVLEVECRGRGDDRCLFAFGSELAVHDLYGKLLDGATLEAALSSS